jgi:hypothetical protein
LFSHVSKLNKILHNKFSQINKSCTIQNHL